MQSKKRKLNGECVFCGKHGILTDDHVPPRNLFIDVPDSELIKVPSCNECNNSSKLDDEYFRAFLIPQAGVADHPQAEKLNHRVFRKFEQNPRKGLEVRVRSQLVEKDVYTPTGIYLGTGTFIFPEYERIDGSLKKIVRGLFFHRIKERLPIEHFNIAVCDEAQIADLQKYMPLIDLEYWRKEVRRWPVHEVQNIFSFRCAVSIRRPPIIAAFGLTFFEARNFFGIVYPHHLGPELVLQNADSSEPIIVDL